MSRAWPVSDIEPDETLAANARRILAVRMAEFYSYAPIVHVEEAVQPLHDLRIARHSGASQINESFNTIEHESPLAWGYRAEAPGAAKA